VKRLQVQHRFYPALATRQHFGPKQHAAEIVQVVQVVQPLRSVQTVVRNQERGEERILVGFRPGLLIPYGVVKTTMLGAVTCGKSDLRVSVERHFG
jgi:hypothetical protein